MNRKKIKMRYLFKTIKLLFISKSIGTKIFSLLQILCGIIPVLVALNMQKITNVLMHTHIDISNIAKSLILLCLFAFVENFIQIIREYCIDRDKITTVKKIRYKVLEVKCSKPYFQIEQRNKLSEKLVMASKLYEFSNVGKYIGIIYLVEDLTVFVLSNLMLMRFSIGIVLLCIGSCLPLVFSVFRKNLANYMFELEGIQERGYENYYRKICTEEKYLNDIRFFNLFAFFRDKWEKYAKEYCKKKKYFLRYYIRSENVAIVIKNFFFCVMLFLCAFPLNGKGIIQLPEYVLIVTLVKRIQDAVLSGAEKLNDFLSIYPYLENFFQLIEEKEFYNSEKAFNEKYRGYIKFEKVCFKYPDSTKECISNLNLKIRLGEKVMLVGENGSGKSTIIKLLCGLIEPTSGKIYIDGYEVSKELWKINYIAAVFQDFAKYDSTLERNITFDENINYEKMTKILQAIDLRYQEFPEKLQEKIGITGKNVRNLSGGQWQKVAICRAMYKESKMIILDEPTAALDPITESQIYSNFLKLIGKRTTILVSHRLSATVLVDRIIILQQGKIIENGTHKKLMDENGIYAKMYKTQASIFR